VYSKSYVPRKAKTTYNLGGGSISFAKHRRKNKAVEVKFLLQAAHFDDESEQVL